MKWGHKPCSCLGEEHPCGTNELDVLGPASRLVRVGGPEDSSKRYKRIKQSGSCMYSSEMMVA